VDRSANATTVERGSALLTPATRQRHRLRRGTSERFEVELRKGDYLAINIAMQRTDAEASLRLGDGSALVDVTPGIDGTASLAAIAPATGIYYLQLTTRAELAQDGSCTIEVTELHPSTERDQHRVAAARLFAEAEKLRADWHADTAAVVIARYQSALDRWALARDASGQSRAAKRIGDVFTLTGDPDAAERQYQASLAFARVSADLAAQCSALSGSARANVDRGRIPIAIGVVAQALPVCRKSGNSFGEAATLNIDGEIQMFSGRNTDALAKFEQARALYASLGDSFGEIEALRNVGLVNTDLGFVDRAEAAYTAALDLSAATRNREGRAATLTSLGHLEVIVGENDHALSRYREAKDLFEVLGDRAGVAMVLNGIGMIHLRAGDPDTAVSQFSLAANLFEATNNPIGQATSMLTLAVALRAADRIVEAHERLEGALTLARSIPDRLLEARALAHMGETQAAQGYLDRAAENFRASESISRALGYSSGVMFAELDVADVLERQHKYDEARSRASDALGLSQSLRHRFAESLALYALAKLDLDVDRVDAALNHIQQSLDVAEQLRGDVASLDLRASYFASVRTRHEFQVGLLMNLHERHPDAEYATLAFNAAERARARSLLDALAQSLRGIREGAPPALLDREMAIRKSLSAAAQRLAQTPHDSAHADAFAALNAEVDRLTNDYREIEARIRAESPRYASLTQPKPATVADVQRSALDESSVLLQYFVGTDRSYVWAVMRDGIVASALPGRREIERLAWSYREALSLAATGRADVVSPGRTRAVGGLAGRNPAADVVKTGAALSRTLLEPIASVLNRPRIVIVADGVLHGIPFGALPDPRVAAGRETPVPLLTGHEVVNLPSASTLLLTRNDWRKEHQWDRAVAVFGDPVYGADDPRIPFAKRAPHAGSTSQSEGSGTADLTRLPATRGEAEGIAALSPQSDIALDFDANRAAVVDSAVGRHRIVHFAVHGFVDDLRPDLSGIALSMFDRNGQNEDGFVRLPDIYGLNLPVDLVVLSACNTGLGRDVAGEGLIGLVRGFMYAGARRVVASLWAVDDEATRELMTRFYRGMFQGGLKPSAALRAAQLALLASAKWNAPYYWAAFVLEGDWN
jgi:CHAT domain-containing protein/tetratricopeptide (TPR) repeat protein